MTHAQFGTGSIVDASETMLTVQFEGSAGQKRFASPAAFRQHLTLCNAAAQTAAAQAASEAEQAVAAAAAQRVQERAAEAERRAAEEAALKVAARKTKKPASRAKPKEDDEFEE